MPAANKLIICIVHGLAEIESEMHFLNITLWFVGLPFD